MMALYCDFWIITGIAQYSAYMWFVMCIALFLSPFIYDPFYECVQ